MSQHREIYILGTGIVTPHGEQQNALPVDLVASSITDSSQRTDTSGLTKFIPKRALRRIDHFSRLALHASFLALEDAGLLETDHENMGVALASGYGAAQTSFSFLDSFFNDGDRLASPTYFSSGLHNAASAYIAMQTKAQGPNICTSNIGLGPAYSLATAVHWLKTGIVDYVLVGGVDEHCQVLEHCVNRFQSAEEGACLLPDVVAGEGAAFLVLGTKPERTTSCVLTDIKIEPYSKQTLQHMCPVFVAPLGLTDQQSIVARITAGENVTNILPVLGSHPSALAFSSVQAVQSILSGAVSEAQAFALDGARNSAVISFSK
ncbi:beta-ketoacyl synthase N-terminal-like domain-containing protein [Halodesulfovibrio aestuarii]|uniref:beta-ketoacyl synthase N-terminal-like domain-containing protein n=1 Tax=Halodesulfovibrio aestuarii TaxID=126333 RepID=UPI003D324F1C